VAHPPWRKEVCHGGPLLLILSTGVPNLSLNMHLISISTDHHVPLKFLRTKKLWEPSCNVFVLWNQPKTSSCRLPYQRYNSSTNCARDLFNGSNGSVIHL